MATTKKGRGRRSRPTAERFWEKVDKSGDCWLWIGKKNQNGYGLFTTWENGVEKGCGAHRMAYALTHGPIAPGLFALHRCDNPSCVNPDHLFLGDQHANMADASRKGRLVGNARPPATHCLRGHEKSPGNVYVWHGQHHCLACRRAADARRRPPKERQRASLG